MRVAVTSANKSVASDGPAPLSAFKTILARRRDAALLQYVLGPDRLSIVLTLPDSTSFIQRDLDASTVNRRIQDLHKALAERADIAIASKALYQDLIAPMDAQLSKARIKSVFSLLSLTGPFDTSPSPPCIMASDISPSATA